ncbi:cytochrome c maturation protein CcmE [Allopusillimonas ginsengisoli]|uniref:cytochrome c maturation protein CcmE n=1 Tax=Allopusillimonas ginsengisoli TaxID=453575 RepID=UPI001021E7D7|nr:cytochrome c maturation protein CcmE [Allopusillimonas ginsengisoli]TEA79350.1 cytochrome c maturation protein CcmE [Allopusillimonas ginsengisoli]
MRARTKRSLILLGGLAALGLASVLVLNAFQSNLVFYFSPSQVAANTVPPGQRFRLGGIVEEGSVQRPAQSLLIHFAVTDGARTVKVQYQGLLPDMFREGKGVVAQGVINAQGVFHADQVLAKHDENYMPPEAAQALEDARLAKGGPQ